MTLAPRDTPAAALGWYFAHTPTGFVLHMCASPRNLRAVRALTAATLGEAGIDPDLHASAQLVLSELYGNALRAGSDYVPLVVEVGLDVDGQGVTVRLHDPVRDCLPLRSGVPLDDARAESGRGLALIDLLAPGWDVARTPVGKQVRCRVGEAECEATPPALVRPLYH
ncbi:ATP-binding protein [Streptomyces diacarni]|uniref:ATP-binding protein n=1 Tax=Streptomyces diacarni TaxID=2800381 RepID=UPI0033D166B7